MKILRRALIFICLAPFRLIWWLISLPFRFLGWLFQPVVTRLKNNRIYKFLNYVPEDRPALEAVMDAFESPEGILDQLDEVRQHLLRSLLAVIVTVGISFWFTQDLITFLAMPAPCSCCWLAAGWLFPLLAR